MSVLASTRRARNQRGARHAVLVSVLSLALPALGVAPPGLAAGGGPAGAGPAPALEVPKGRTGAFAKTLPASVSQFGDDNRLFNTHGFDYHDDVRDPSGTYNAFADAASWSVRDDRLGVDIREGEAGAISANTSASFGAHLYADYNVQGLPTKEGSFGLKVGFSAGQSDGLSTLTDVNGVLRRHLGQPPPYGSGPGCGPDRIAPAHRTCARCGELEEFGLRCARCGALSSYGLSRVGGESAPARTPISAPGCMDVRARSRRKPIRVR
ncbi:hypothetical protein ACFZBU_40455 [Embleya sp. NPDC008237]|uniref:hypothetical protein n=1 Tax=Embleya sp. NPDC008237 TaxID=3363978 RepID=UPI0036E97386